MARKRKKMSRKRSRREFSSKASRVHKRNVHIGPMRGGIRL